MLYLFSDHQFFHGLDRSEFEKRLSLSVKNCHFIFDGCLYQQVDGVAMGTPLGPLFANIFMSLYEQKMAKQLSFFLQTSTLQTLC